MQAFRGEWLLCGLLLLAGCRSAITPFAAPGVRAPVRGMTGSSATGRACIQSDQMMVQSRAHFARAEVVPTTAVAVSESPRNDAPAPQLPPAVMPETGPAAATLQLASAENISPAFVDVAAPGDDTVRGDEVAHNAATFRAWSPAMSLTLDGAIATSLERNPSLVALRAGEPVATAAYRVAETYPWNPFVQVQVLPYSRDREGNTGSVNHYVWLMQTLELAHQGQFREESAAAAWNQVRWNIVQAELATTAQTERLYFTTVYQRDLRDLAQRTADINSDLLSIVERRFDAGLATAAEPATARVIARQARKQADVAEANYQTALLALRRQLNLPTGTPLELVGRLGEFAWLPITGIESAPAGQESAIRVPHDVAADLACHRPDVIAAQAGVNVAHANAELARANMVPNLGIGPFYERDDNGTVFAGFRTQMNLPVWDSGRPLSRQREAEVHQQFSNFEQLRSRAEVEVETAIERYERARRMAARHRAENARDVPDELQSIQEQFEAGQANILNVFAIQNGILQEERTDLDLLNELAQAAADVTLAAGLPPARVISGHVQ